MIELNVSQRHIEGLEPEQLEALKQALSTTTHYILGMRDGSCFRYESEIKNAREMCSMRAVTQKAAQMGMTNFVADQAHRALLLEAVRVPQNISVCSFLEKKGWLKFTGNQHNPGWEWIRERLETVETLVLERIFFLRDYSGLVSDSSRT